MSPITVLFLIASVTISCISAQDGKYKIFHVIFESSIAFM